MPCKPITLSSLDFEMHIKFTPTEHILYPHKSLFWQCFANMSSISIKFHLDIYICYIGD